jgi:hypothetical protein
MIFQNGFGSSKEVVSPREPEPKLFLEKPEPCQRGPKMRGFMWDSETEYKTDWHFEHI